MSKKLEGNGLWESSRMMLPQHKEQSVLQNQALSPTREPPTKKELELMRDCIILPVALHIVEKNRLEIERSAQTLRLLYAAAAKVLAGRIKEDVHKSKKLLVEKNIRLFEGSKEDTQLTYRYVCRGHEDTLLLTKEYMRAEIGVRIGRYAKGLAAAMQTAAKHT